MSTMAVYRAKNGWCYKGRIPVPFQKGKYKDYYKSGFKKKSDAIKAEQAFRDSYSTNMSDLTLDRIVALYHENYRMQNVKESTLIGDESYYNHHIKPVLGNYRLNDITPQAVERWKSYMINKPKFDKKRNSNEHYSASSVNHAKNVLSKYLSYAVRLGYIPYNPCHNVPGYINKEEIKNQKLDNFWEVDEFKKYCQTEKNIMLDEEKEYVDTFWKSDILVTDGSGIVPEYLMTQRPIVYCHCQNKANWAEYAKAIIDCSYQVYNQEDLERYIGILLENNDYMSKERQDCLNQYFKDVGNNSSSILDVLAKP